MDDSKETKIANFWQSAKIRFASIATFIIISLSVVSQMVGKAEGWRDAMNWVLWIYERANTPWLGLFLLVSVSIIFYWGVREVIKAEKDSGPTIREENEQHKLNIQTEFDAALKRVATQFRVSEKIAQYATLTDQLTRQKRLLERGRNGYDELKTMCDNWKVEHEWTVTRGFRGLKEIMTSINHIQKGDDSLEWEWPDEYSALKKVYAPHKATDYEAGQLSTLCEKLKAELDLFEIKLEKTDRKLSEMKIL